MNYKVTPRGSIVVTKGGIAELTWNPGFAPKWNEQIESAQKFLESEILSQCEPYIPLQTGMLIKSGTLGTELGSGVVQWIAPYAKKQYHKTSDSRSYDPMRGAHWFQRMWADHGAEITEGTKKIAGGGK